MSAQSKSVAKGISILGITGIINKFIGVLYSIPLARILGDQGLGLFQTVFPTYNLLLTVSSAGLPVAVSRMVAHYLAKEDGRNARRVFRFALLLLSCIGAFFSVLLLLTSGFLVRVVGVEEAVKGFRAIAPCVGIVCVLSAFRGFFQGQQNMVPTALSQFIEQVGRVAVALPLAALGMKRSMADGAAGALLGITIVELFALIYMVIRYFWKKQNLTGEIRESSEPPASAAYLIRRLAVIAIPVTISACIIPFSSFIDSAMMVNRMVSSGLPRETATSLYGVFSGMVLRLINIPTALALAISMSLVPAVSAAKALENGPAIRAESNTGIRYAFLIGFPCAIGMSVLAKPILALFYLETLSAEKLQTASELLTFSALTIVLFTVVQATSSILQGLHRQKIPMYTMMAGVACKIILNYLLIGTPGIHIHGGPIASIVCYSVALIPNLILCCRYTGMPFDWKGWLLRPGIAAGAMGIGIRIMRLLLPLTRLSTILEILAGIVIYVAVAFLDHALSAKDLKAMLRR